ncbi:MAG: hypothetical protein ACJ8EF_04205 [Bradyrhizobium sp.]|jgi:hypothetical protein
MARRTNRRWTEEDDRRLIELSAASRPPVLISADLKRSTLAVYGRLSFLRVRQRAANKQSDVEGAAGPDHLQDKLRD